MYVRIIFRPIIYLSDYSICGASQTNLRARIVGGNRAGRGTWPWQAGIYKQVDGRSKMIQNNSVIST